MNAVDFREMAGVCRTLADYGFELTRENVAHVLAVKVKAPDAELWRALAECLDAAARAGVVA